MASLIFFSPASESRFCEEVLLVTYNLVTVTVRKSTQDVTLKKKERTSPDVL